MPRPPQHLRFIYMYTGKGKYPNNLTPVIPPAYTACEGGSVPKRRHTKFRRRGIAQKKEHNIQNRAEV